MRRDRALDLILRTRLSLERLRAGDLDRGLINHLAQICIISGYVARTGRGGLAPETCDLVEQQLTQLLLDFEASGTWSAPSDPLRDGVTDVVNAYDRMLTTVRVEILAKASDHLNRLKAIAANEEPRPVESRAGRTPTNADAAQASV